MFKFELGQLVFYLMDNRVHSANVISRMCIENKDEAKACTKEQDKFYMAFGKSTVSYSTCHGIVNEGSCFKTREELLSSL